MFVKKTTICLFFRGPGKKFILKKRNKGVYTLGPLKNRLDWSLETGKGMAKKVAATIEVIKDKEFDGNAALLAEDWIPLIVPNFDNLAPKYAENWQETPIAFLAAELSDDCATLDTITWVTEGEDVCGSAGEGLARQPRLEL